MRKGFWFGAAGAGLLAVAVSGCRVEERDVDAAELYERTCARCHGASGEGGVAAAPGEPAPRDLTDPAWQRSRSDEELARVVVSGSGSMPSFADVLAPEEVESLVSHVRSLEAVPVAEGASSAGGGR